VASEGRVFIFPVTSCTARNALVSWVKWHTMTRRTLLSPDPDLWPLRQRGDAAHRHREVQAPPDALRGGVVRVEPGLKALGHLFKLKHDEPLSMFTALDFNSRP